MLAGQLPIAHAELPVPCAAGCGPGAFVSSGSVQAPVVAGSRMTIRQSSANTVLNWQTFNIGGGNTVEFQQPSATAIAVNRVWDPSGNPSQILGSLQANGQVYLVNRNGILFGEGARIDVASLVASSLDITDAALSRGLIRAFSDGTDRQPAFVGAVDGSGNPLNGDVTIASGAVLRARDGGQILVFAPNIVNEGRIETPNGQTVLGAGSKIYLLNSTDSNLRGLVVEVDVEGVSDAQLQEFLRGERSELPLGSASNFGSIDVGNGNATLVGLAVNQSGRISATTSVRANGSVLLRAAYRPDPNQIVNGVLQATRTGKVEFGEGSVTEVLPDYADKATTVDVNAQPRSRVTALGHRIHVFEDARITATGGEVTLTAQADPRSGEAELAALAANDSRILLAAGSIIDVSGASTELPADRLLLEVELRAEELKDSPLQRDGVLRGKKVTVDLRKQGVREDGTVWVGTPLADLTGAVETVERSVAERNAAGGTVKMVSQGDVIVAPEALIDISGGRIDYAAGQLKTTLLSSGGRLYDISEADPSIIYDGVVGQYSRTSSKWGVTRTWEFPGVSATTYTEAFSEGRDAGSVIFNTPRLILDGGIDGSVVQGLYQREPGTAPTPGRLVIGYEDAGSEIARHRIGSLDFREEFLFGDLVMAGFDPLRDAFPVLETVLRPSLFSGDGVGIGQVFANSTITLGSDVALTLPAGGELGLSAANIDIAGSISVPGGEIAADAVRTVSVPQIGAQTVSLREGAVLDTAGRWINDGVMAGGPDGTPLWIDGGSVELASDGGEVLVEDGARIDVAGGAWREVQGGIVAGTGGDITLDAGTGGTVLLGNAELDASSLSRGGSFSLTSNSLCIGGAACGETDAMVLAPEFFGAGGFGSYRLTASLGDLIVAGDADLRLVQKNRVLDASHVTRETGADLASFSRLETLPDYLRSGTDVTLRTTGNHPAEMRIEQGASIAVDPGSSIALAFNSRLWMDGVLSAPGGDISLEHIDSNFSIYGPNDVIWLGRNAVLDVSGVALMQPSAVGLRTGEVMEGGTVALRTQRGYVIAEAGSRIDVSGASATLDLPRIGGGYRAQVVSSDAGTIDIAAAEGAILAGTLRGEAGGELSRGGALSLSLDGNNRGEPPPGPSNDYPHAPRIIEVVGGEAGDELAGFTYETMDGAFTLAHNGRARLHTAVLAEGGFDALALSARHLLNTETLVGSVNPIAAPGSVSIAADLHLERSLVIDAPTITAAAPEVTISAPYVALGSTDSEMQIVPAPVAGARVLTVDAGWLDLIGASGVSGVDRVTLRSASDLRLRALPKLEFSANELTGSFTTAGSLELQAAQIYPATLTDFAFNALDIGAGAGSITVLAGDAASAGPVLSAGGALRLHASRIENQGVLKAPFGFIELDAGADGDLILAPGSVLSTSSEDLVIPFGRTEGGLDWSYDFGNNQKLVFSGELDALPSQRIQLNGARLELREGSRLDVSAGGDLQAYEFVPGIGGSRDILANDASGRSFAILPTLGETIAPYDHMESAGFVPAIGATLHIEGVDGLAAGEYALLPARYALLPGAYLITERPGYQDLQPGLGLRLTSGVALVSGSYGIAGTDQRDSRTRGFTVQSSALLRDASPILRPAEYTLSLATQFFVDGSSGVRLPRDAGTVSLSALEALDLRAALDATKLEGGRGAAFDIASPELLITAIGGETEAGVLSVGADVLAALGAESILLGGRRGESAEGTLLEAVSDEVRIAGGVDLAVPELLLIARDRVALDDGARIAGVGDASSGDGAFLVNGDGALVRVSGGGFVDIVRRDATGTSGTIEIREGATVEGTGAVALDAEAGIVFDGDLQVENASLLVGAPRINLGDAPAEAEGFSVDAETLAALNAAELRLRGRAGIDLYGDIRLGADTLVLDTPVLGGRDNADAIMRIEARQFALGNAGDAAAPAAPANGGRLEVMAEDIRLGGGTYAIAGFEEVALNAERTLLGRDEGRLEVAGDLELSAGAIGGERGATTGIAAAGDVTIVGGDAGLALDETAIGASLAIEGAGIHHGGRIMTQAGIVSLSASGENGVTVADGAIIDAAGVMREFDTARAFAPGGAVALSAAIGDVVIEEGATVTVAGALGGDGAGGDAGRIVVTAPEGTIRIDADIDGSAAAGKRQGRIALDGATIAGVDALNARLNAGGFIDERVLRIREGDVDLGGDITASLIDIMADGGALRIGAMLDASGESGGRVRLAARDAITLDGVAGIDVSASDAGEDGGKVEMMSSEGGVRLLAGSAIDASAGGASEGVGAGEDGSVLLRVNRDVLADVLADDDAVALDGTIIAGETIVEGVQVYDLGTGDATVTGAQTASSSAIWNDASAFMQDTNAIAAALGRDGDAGFHVRPGVELRAGGNLTLASPWDLFDWHFNGEPGYLTLRAGGDININSPVSDGFPASASFFNFLGLPTQDSWSYRLTAGADLVSASPFAVLGDTGAGDFRLAADTHIRTGTGDIAIAAAGDVRLANDGSVIYTAGVPVGDLPQAMADFINIWMPFESPALMENGGDISIVAGGSIVGVPPTKPINNWLWRMGTPVGDTFPSPTMWGIDFSRFRHGVGALAGGDVTLRAGADIDNVSAAIPSIGVPMGETEFDNEPEVRGGGRLLVEAGGDIGGGLWYLGKGSGELYAGGDIRGGTGWTYLGRPLNTVLALGDGEFSLTARGDTTLETVIDPTLLPQNPAHLGFFTAADFSTYAPDSGVRMMSIAGDARVSGEFDGVGRAIDVQFLGGPSGAPSSETLLALSVFPPTLRVSALSGDVVTGVGAGGGRWIRLAPAPQGQAELLAYGDVRFLDNGLLLAGSDPAFVPTPRQPQILIPSAEGATFSWPRLFQTSGQFAYADLPVHSPAAAEAAGYEGPREPAMIVALTGDIDMSGNRPSSTGTPTVMSAKSAKLIAGGDIINPALAVLHTEATDVSLISAGGDIGYTVARNERRQIAEQFAQVAVDGPGELILLAGGGLDLKASPGIETRGNTVSPTLAETGASITVVTGIAQAPDYEAFIAHYLEQGDAYAEALAAYLTAQGVDAAGTPLDVFRTLPRERQIPFLTQVLFSELRAAGRKAAAEGSSDFEGGYAALEILFPGIDPESDPRGDVSLFFSRIYTLDGGDIDILAPGGVVNVGLSTPPTSFGLNKSPSQLGIVAQRSGSVNVLSGNDTLVNQSRVFAADGGSILMWSSAGDIDAGRGAKSAISAPAAVIIYDANGLPTVEFPPALTGSGIRAFVTTPGREPGDVDLYAPVGVINAGDAGIGSAGNVTVAATEVIGADNIDIGGVAVGVPVADTGGLAAGLTGASNVGTAASKSSEEALGGGGADAAGDTPLADAAFAVLDVVVLGLGLGGNDGAAEPAPTPEVPAPARQDCPEDADCGA